jgi:CubicO group peptidase (beta-lactamase class C family)
MRAATTCALMAVIVASLCATTLVGQAKPDFSAVRDLIKAEMAATSTPSMAVAVARGDEILWEEGFGWIDRPGGTTATAHTLYYAASVTKAITDEATVRHLATHTGGLTTYDSREPISADETIRRYGVVFWQPGARFDYSNLGFGVLGKIISDVSGRSFRAFVHDELFRPLSMVNAWAGATPTSHYPVAPRYSTLLRGFSPPLAEPSLPGGSVLYCSAHELALFGMFHLKARQAGQKAVLSDAGINGLQHPTVDAGNAQQSLAWRIDNNQHGYRTLLAQGGTFDSQAWLLLVPLEKIAVVILSNFGSASTTKPIDEILSILLPNYRENLAKAAAASTANPPAAPAVVAVPPEVAGVWSGKVQTYRGNVPLTMRITSTGEAEATLGKQTPVKMNTVRVSSNRVSGRTAGDLGIDYADRTPYELRFYLDRYDNHLIGAAVTYAMPGHDGPRFPFWVELKRARRR